MRFLNFLIVVIVVGALGFAAWWAMFYLLSGLPRELRIGISLIWGYSIAVIGEKLSHKLNT